MESFVFNDITSESLSIIVKEMPLVPRAERNIESINVIGRNGNFHIDNKNYLSKDYTIDCIAKDKSKIDDICKTFVGTHKLKLSKYPNKYWNATIKNQIDFDIYLNYLNEFPLQFELDPIGYSEKETIENLNSSGSITVGGNVEIYPIITIIGIGTVTINGYPLQVLESGITINCDLMQCYNGEIAKNDKVILDEFPNLSVGSNDITLGEGISNVKIEYRQGWL